MSLPLRTLDSVPATPRNRDRFATRTRRSLWIAGISTAGLLILLVALVYDFSTAGVLFGVGAFTFLIAFAVYYDVAPYHRSLDPFSPYILFPIAYIVWFVAGSINFIDVPSNLVIGYSPFDPIPNWMYKVYALGLAGYIVGLLLARTLPDGEAATNVTEIDPRKMHRMVQALLIGTVIFWLITQAQFGFPVRHPNMAGEARLEIHGAFFQTFIALSWTSAVFSPFHIWLRAGKQRFDSFWKYGVPVIIFLLLLSLGARSRAAVPLLCIMIARAYLSKKPTWKLFFGGVIIFILFSEFGYYRDDSSWNQKFLEAAGLPGWFVPIIYSALYIRYTVDALRGIIAIIPSHVPFQHGALTLTPFSSLLPGHHDMSDIFFKKILGLSFEGSGQPATLLGPLYGDFGWIGIFSGMVGYGVLLSWTFRRIKGKSSAVAVLIYAWWMQATILGLYGNGFGYLIQFVMPLFWYVLLNLSKATRRPIRVFNNPAARARL